MNTSRVANSGEWAEQAGHLQRFALRHFHSGDLVAVTLHLRSLGDARLPVTSEPWHTPDFSIVVWEGERYEFGHKQRLVIEALWNAYEAGRPILDSKTLLRLAESDAESLHHLFKRNIAWGTLVRPVGLSAYHLAFAWIPPLAEGAQADQPEVVED